MNRSKRLLLAGVGIILLSVLSSCNVSKKAIREPIKEQGEAFLLSKLRENQINFNTLVARFDATFIVDKSETSINGQIRILKDSAIWISLTPALGIEMARFLFTPDSIKFLNRMNDTYMEKNFSYIDKLINTTVDFDMVQSLITGNDFAFYDTTNFKASLDNDLYKLQTTNRRKTKRNIKKYDLDVSFPFQTFWLDPVAFKIKQLVLKDADKESRKFTANYNDHHNINGQLVPANLIFEVRTDNDKVNLTVNLSKITINEVVSMPYRVPESYTKIEEFKKIDDK